MAFIIVAKTLPTQYNAAGSKLYVVDFLIGGLAWGDISMAKEFATQEEATAAFKKMKVRAQFKVGKTFTVEEI